MTVPRSMRHVTGGERQVPATGATIAEVIANLDAKYPGFRVWLCQGDDLKKGCSVIVDSHVGEQRMLQPVRPDSLIEFLQQMEGG